MSAGKGDTYRKVDGEKYRDNWEKIFGDTKPIDNESVFGIKVIPIKGIPEGEAFLVPDPEALSTAIKITNFK